jgi:hypothetical protein
MICETICPQGDTIIPEALSSFCSLPAGLSKKKVNGSKA